MFVIVVCIIVSRMSWKVKLVVQAWKETKENQAGDIMTPAMEELEPQEFQDLQ